MTVIAHFSHETKWNGLGHRDDCHRSERRHEHRSGTSRSVVSHWHDELEYIERTERRGSGRRDTAHRRPRWWNGRWSGWREFIACHRDRVLQSEWRFGDKVWDHFERCRHR